MPNAHMARNIPFSSQASKPTIVSSGVHNFASPQPSRPLASTGPIASSRPQAEARGVSYASPLAEQKLLDPRHVNMIFHLTVEQVWYAFVRVNHDRATADEVVRGLHCFVRPPLTKQQCNELQAAQHDGTCLYALLRSHSLEQVNRYETLAVRARWVSTQRASTHTVTAIS